MALSNIWRRVAILVLLLALSIAFIHAADSEDPPPDSEEAADSDDGKSAGSSEVADGDYSGNQYFAVPAFFVCLREAIEACVIVSILLKFVDKINKPELKKDIWIGAGLGLLIAILAGVGFITAFYVAEDNFFKGKVEYIFEGILMVFASVVITVLAMSMLKINRFQELWERKLRARMEAAEAQGASLRHSTMFWLPFISVLREGIETVIFLAGAGAGYPAKSIPIPGILGLLVGFAVGYALYAAGSLTSVHTFLVASTVLLMFIAAGLLSHGAHEFQEANAFGTYENEDGEHTSVWHTPAWDICDCCPNDNDGWAVVRALVGYTCNPTPVEIFSYLLYWVVAIPYCAYKVRACCFSKVPMKGDNDTVPNKALIADDAKYVEAQVAPVSSAKPV